MTGRFTSTSPTLSSRRDGSRSPAPGNRSPLTSKDDNEDNFGWVGYSPASDSWLKGEDLEDCYESFLQYMERYPHPRSIATSLSSKDATARVLREQFERVATNVKIIDHTIKDPKHPELIQFFVKEADDDQGQWITEPNVKGRYTHAWMIYAEERGWIPKGRPPDP